MKWASNNQSLIPMYYVEVEEDETGAQWCTRRIGSEPLVCALDGAGTARAVSFIKKYLVGETLVVPEEEVPAFQQQFTGPSLQLAGKDGQVQLRIKNSRLEVEVRRTSSGRTRALEVGIYGADASSLLAYLHRFDKGVPWDLSDTDGADEHSLAPSTPVFGL